MLFSALMRGTRKGKGKEIKGGKKEQQVSSEIFKNYFRHCDRSRVASQQLTALIESSKLL